MSMAIGRDGFGTEIAGSGDVLQQHDGGAKGFDVRVHLFVDEGDGCAKDLDLIHMQLEERFRLTPSEENSCPHLKWRERVNQCRSNPARAAERGHPAPG